MHFCLLIDEHPHISCVVLHVNTSHEVRSVSLLLVIYRLFDLLIQTQLVILVLDTLCSMKDQGD